MINVGTSRLSAHFIIQREDARRQKSSATWRRSPAGGEAHCTSEAGGGKPLINWHERAAQDERKKDRTWERERKHWASALKSKQEHSLCTPAMKWQSDVHLLTGRFSCHSSSFASFHLQLHFKCVYHIDFFSLLKSNMHPPPLLHCIAFNI